MLGDPPREFVAVALRMVAASRGTTPCSCVAGDLKHNHVDGMILTDIDITSRDDIDFVGAVIIVGVVTTGCLSSSYFSANLMTVRR